MKTLGQRIQELRKLNRLTGEELGKKLDVAKSTVSLWESGARTPSADMIRSIAGFFNVSIDYLLNGSDPTNEGYYIDPEVAELANQIKQDPELRLLLDAKRNLSKQDMQSIINITKALLQRERGDDIN